MLRTSSVSSFSTVGFYLQGMNINTNDALPYFVKEHTSLLLLLLLLYSFNHTWNFNR